MTKRSQYRLTPLNEEIRRVRIEVFKKGSDSETLAYLKGLEVAKELVKNAKKVD